MSDRNADVSSPWNSRASFRMNHASHRSLVFHPADHGYAAAAAGGGGTVIFARVLVAHMRGGLIKRAYVVWYTR